MRSAGPAIDPRLPVLVGVGTCVRPAPVSEMMTAAAVAAGADAGPASLLGAVDRLAVPQGTWTVGEPAHAVATRIGAGAARTYRYEIGVSQQEIVNDALLAIRSGEAEVVLIVGGEARAFARHGGTEVDDPTTSPPDVTITRQPDFVAPIEQAAGIVVPPVQQYALIENALAAHEHQDVTSHRDDVAALWSRFNAVAGGNPEAAFPAPRTPDAIATPGPRNRPLAYPYNVWHASQWTVDQAAALLLCSADRATRARVPRDRWVFPHVALHASGAITLAARGDLHAWPAMEVLGRAASAHVGRAMADIRIAEVYSCFPSAVRVQQRALGLDPEGTPTVTGGMTFAGGPFNNYVFQSTAAVVRLLREAPEELGLVTTVCGMLSKPGLALWSATPPSREVGALIADLDADAAAATATREVTTPELSTGPATVVSFTVTYAADDPGRPVRTAIVADRADGSRATATCEDESFARAALSQSPIGQTVHLESTSFTL